MKQMIRRLEFYGTACLLRYICLIMYFFISVHCLNAQSYILKNITTEDGLSQNSAIHMVQDSLGFVWIATQDGLNRYDGSNFVRYDKYFDDLTRPDYLSLGKLMVDRRGRIWIIPKSKIIEVYSHESDQFTRLESLKNASALGLLPNGHVLVGTRDGSMIEVDENFKVISNHLPGEPDRDNPVHQIYLDSTGVVWAIVQDKVIRFQKNEKGQLLKPEEVQVTQKRDVQFTCIEMTEDGIWVATLNDELYLKRQGSSVFLPYDKWPGTRFNNHPKVCFSMMKDGSGNLWCALNGFGIVCINKGLDEVDEINSQNPTDFFRIEFDFFLSSLIDKNGNLWFGTDGEGIYLLENKFNFKVIRSDRTIPGFTPGQIRAVLKNENKIWVGSWQYGLFEINLTKKDFKWQKVILKEGQKTYSNLISLWGLENGKIAVGTVSDGIFIKKADQITAQKVPQFINGTKVNIRANRALRNPDGTFWVASQNFGLVRMDSKLNIQDHFIYKKDEGFNSILTIEKHENKIWLGYESKGLMVFDTETNKFVLSDFESKLPSKYIKCLQYDAKREVLWIGFSDAGLIGVKVNENPEKIIRIQDLPNKTVYSVLADESNNLWLSSNRGIHLVQFENEKSIQVRKIVSFGTNDGLQSLEFNTGAYFKERDGTLLMGGIKGLNWFNPAQFKMSQEPPTPYVQHVLVNLDTLSGYFDFNKIDSITLKYFENNITVSISALDYNNGKSAKLRYRLVPLNTEWVDNFSDRIIRYNKLRPGKYRLQIAASSNNSTWSDLKEIFIEIKKPWYQSIWFYAILGICFAGLVYLIYRYGIRAYLYESRLKSRHRAQILELELKALRTQMNPHLVFNCLSSIEYLIIQKNEKAALNYLNIFSKLIRNSLENSKVSRITLRQEIESLRLYLEIESFRFNEKFACVIDIQETIDLDFTLIPPMIIQPIVENSIKHGLLPKMKDCLLKIRFYKSPGMLHCEVEDNGVGRNLKKENPLKDLFNKTSIGLSTTEQRLQLIYNKVDTTQMVEVIDLKDSLDLPIGTKVIINIPLIIQ